VVDPTAWGDRTRVRPVLVDVLQDAVVRRRKVRLTYRGRAGSGSERLVDPWGLVDKDDVWYLLAGTSAGQRTFRVDRIESATATDLVADRPADFELSAAWQEVVSTVEVRRSLVSAAVLVPSVHLWVLQDHFGRHCHVEEHLPDGRVRARVAAPTPLMIAQQLAGWGEEIEVVGPDPVCDELARIGAELTARYALG
jgi:predicted DNA-binding transcriptional regulator YafY